MGPFSHMVSNTNLQPSELVAYERSDLSLTLWQRANNHFRCQVIENEFGPLHNNHALNVNLKCNFVQAWLRYVVNQPLYNHNITIDWSLFHHLANDSTVTQSGVIK